MRLKRQPTPHETILDRQSLKTPGTRGPRGYDAGEKITGRKCHFFVDTKGLLMKAWGNAAEETDAEALMCCREAWPRASSAWPCSGSMGLHAPLRRVGRSQVELAGRGCAAPGPGAVLCVGCAGPGAAGAAGRFPRTAAPLGRGAHLCLGGTQPPAAQRLRSITGQGGGVDQRCIASPPPASVCPMTPFHSRS